MLNCIESSHPNNINVGTSCPEDTVEHKVEVCPALQAIGSDLVLAISCARPWSWEAVTSFCKAVEMQSSTSHPSRRQRRPGCRGSWDDLRLPQARVCGRQAVGHLPIRIKPWRTGRCVPRAPHATISTIDGAERASCLPESRERSNEIPRLYQGANEAPGLVRPSRLTLPSARYFSSIPGETNLIRHNS